MLFYRMCSSSEFHKEVSRLDPGLGDLASGFTVGPSEAFERGLFLGRQRTQRILLTAGHDAPQSTIRKYVGAVSVHHSPSYGYAHVT